VSLLLSSIWVQATSVENGPANYEAMAHTYSIALLFTRSKVRLVHTKCHDYFQIFLINKVPKSLCLFCLLVAHL
jgi:hypothetical protein